MFGPKETKVDPDFEVFTVFDSKVGAYRKPILAENRFEIFRDLERMFRDPNTQSLDLVTNSEDFQVFKIGSWFKKEGRLEVCRPEHIINIHEVRSAVQQKMAQSNVTQLSPSGH